MPRDDLYKRSLAAARAELDRSRHLIGGPTYRPPQSLPLAQAMLASGSVDDAREAAAIVAAVLDSQELAEGHPYRGNFRWLADDPEVVDLNAVQFVLRGLLPLLVRQGSKLPPALLGRCRGAVRLALIEEERLNVQPTYTNIHLMSLLALVVGGEWLEDERFAGLGRERWARWVAETTDAGAPHEFASPGYGAVDLGALAELADLARDPLVRLQARLMYERVFLHLWLHLHGPSGQFAGPHCRAYWGAMTTGRSELQGLIWLLTGEGEPATSLEMALTPHWLPPLPALPLPAEVREGSTAGDLTTYLAPSFALGTASRTYGIGQDCFYIEHHANYLIAHWAGGGLMYSRYTVNDQHHGTKAAAPDRSKDANFYDFGNFAGVQSGGRAIGLYALQPQSEEVFSLKTVVAFQRWPSRVFVDGRAAGAGDSVEAGSWLVVRDGPVWVGVRMLEHSFLGGERRPVVLERGPEGELWLTAHNYRGAAKRFWDYASLRGAFWRGNLRAGLVIEVAPVADFASPEAFVSHVRSLPLTDEVDAERIRRVRFGGLAIEYDLWRTAPGRRAVDGRVVGDAVLESPVARQGSSGRLAVGEVVLETEPGVMTWLMAPAVAVVPTGTTRLRLSGPGGVVEAERFGPGRVAWREGEVAVEGFAQGLRLPLGAVVRKGESLADGS